MRGKTIFLVLAGLAWLGAGLAVAQPTVNVTITYVSTGKTYQVATANPGEYLYTDRDRTYGYRFLPDRTTPAPDPTVALETTAPVLFGQKFIRVSNDDKNQTVARYLEFTIDKPCTIYIAYDKRGLPASLGGTGGDPADWLEDGTWTLTPYTVCWYQDNATPSQDGSSPMPVFAKDFEAGTVTLGGPRFGTQIGVNTNYIPFIVPKDPTYNPPPVVDVEPEYQKVYLGESGAALTATVTDEDPEEGEPGVLSWYWAKKSGPGDVTFSPSAPSAPEVTASFSAKGIYEILCQATDGTKDANDVVTVRVVDPADEQLIAHYPLDGDGLDAVGDRDMVAIGDTSYVDGVSGLAANLDGAGDFFVQADPNFALGDALNGGYEITVSCWVKSNIYDTDKGFIIFEEPAGNDDMDMRYDEAGATGGGDAVLKMGITTTGGVLQLETASQSQSTQWQHVVMTWQSHDRIKGYINGLESVYTAQSGASGGVLTDFEALIIGRGGKDTDPNSMGWDGLIDDVRVYNYALPLEADPGEDSIRSLAAMGPLPAVVDAGPDETYLLNPSIPYQLQGSVADFGRESGNVALWQVQSTIPDGLPEPMFSDDGTNPAGTVQFFDGGVYVLQLTVIDGDYPDEPISDTVTITVETPTCQDVIDAGLVLPGDLNQDCEVNLADLALMLEKWTLCNDPADPDCPWPF